MPAVTTDDGVSISYATAGEGPPHLLFMHGWAGSGRYFDATIEQLDLTRLRAVTFDLRGHRESDPATDGYTLERIAADALAVADAAGARRVRRRRLQHERQVRASTCRWSAPERVVGQILVAGCPAGEIPLPARAHRRLAGPRGRRRADGADRRAYMTRPVAPRAARAVRPRTPRRSVAPRSRAPWTPSCATSFTDRLASITTPTLVVGGQRRPDVRARALRAAVVAPLPGARLALLDCGHEIPIEPPGELAALIEAFLGGLGDRQVAREGARFARALGAKPGSLLPSGG